MEVEAITDAVVSHAAASGWFEQVNEHEPKNAPGYGLTAAVWCQGVAPIPGRSGLANTSGRLLFNVRLYANMTSEPQGQIDPRLLGALDALFAAYSGDFTLDGLIGNVDLLGSYGLALTAVAGYVDVSGVMYRVMTITLPLIVNDLWNQVA